MARPSESFRSRPFKRSGRPLSFDVLGGGRHAADKQNNKWVTVSPSVATGEICDAIEEGATCHDSVVPRDFARARISRFLLFRNLAQTLSFRASSGQSKPV